MYATRLEKEILAHLIRVHFKIMYSNKTDIRMYNNLLFIFSCILNLRNLTKFKTYKPVQFIFNFRIMYLMPEDGQYDRNI